MNTSKMESKFDMEPSMDTFEALPVDVHRNCLLMQHLDTRLQKLNKDIRDMQRNYKNNSAFLTHEEKQKYLREFKEKFEDCCSYADDKYQLATQNLALINKLIGKADFEYAKFKSQFEEKAPNVAEDEIESRTNKDHTNESSGKKTDVSTSSSEDEPLSVTIKRKEKGRFKTPTGRKAGMKSSRKKCVMESSKKKCIIESPTTTVNSVGSRNSNKKGDANNPIDKKEMKTTQDGTPISVKRQRKKKRLIDDEMSSDKNEKTELTVEIKDKKKSRKGDVNKLIGKERNTSVTGEEEESAISDRNKRRKDDVENSSDKIKVDKPGTGSDAGSSSKSGRKKKDATANTPTAKNDASCTALQNLYSPVDIDMPVYPNEPTYCLCNQVSFGIMIGCDNPNCPIEWFHFDCLKLTAKPKGKWFCPQCRVNMKKK